MPYSKKQPRFANVTIDRLSTKGHGIGVFQREDGTTAEAEVSFAIPGDKIKAALLGKKRGRKCGKIEEITTPSPDRITPVCLHFGSCGGCKWQQMEYKTQLNYKEGIVKKVFADLINPSVKFSDIVGSHSEWAYRNKMEFSFSTDSSQNKYLGLIIDSSKGRVLNLTECHLVNTWYIDALKAVRYWWEESTLDSYHMFRNTGSLRTLTLREGTKTGDRMVILTVSGNPDFALNKHHLETFVSAIRNSIEPAGSNSKLSIFMRIQQIAKGMSTNFYEMLLYGSDHIEEELDIQVGQDQASHTFKFTISPSAFFQPNTKQAEKFYSLALQMAGVTKESVVYDLYCGTGTLGICASRVAKQVIGVEISPEAALDARQNAALNKCDNVTIFSGAVRHMLTQIHEEKKYPAPGIVLVDPPRPGLDPDALRALIKMAPPKILYISCNPATQAENVAELIKEGYVLEAIQPIDQFPQTVHIENLVLLTRSS